MKKKILFFIILLLISIPIVLPFFQQGFYPSHDGEWAVVRLGDMYRELRDFQIPPRFSGNLNFSYGYPLFNFAYPFPYYLGMIFQVIGFSLVDSIKIIFALTVPLSAITMYLLSKNVWKDSFAGLISATLYLYLPYRFVDLFVRGSIGESTAFVIFPLVLLALLCITDKGKSRFYFFIGAFSYAALILTHNIMAVLFTPVMMLFVLIIHEKNKITFTRFTAIALGLGLSAFFWLPAIIEKQFIYLAQIPIADRSLYFVTLLDLMRPTWGYGTPTSSNPFTYQIGWPHLLTAFIAAFYGEFSLIKRKLKRTEVHFKVFFLLMIIIFISVFMLFQPSHVVWESLPVLKEINYPWTLLAIIGFVISLLSGILAKQKILRILGLILSIFAIIFFLPYAKPEYYVNRGDNFYLTNEATTTSSREYTPLWVKQLPLERAIQKVEIVKGEVDVENVISKSNSITFQVNAKTDSTVRVNTIFYPGWRAFIDGKETKIRYDNPQGVMEISVPKSGNMIRLVFSETSLRLTADIISMISGVLLVLATLLWSKLLFFKME